MKPDTPILMARIGGPHGVMGEVRVKAYGDNPMALADYGALHSNDGRKFLISHLRPSRNVMVVKFKGINHRDEAQALNGVDLYIERSALPVDMDEDEFYVSDLIGCQVVDESGGALGSVKAVLNFGAGDLIEIVDSGSGQSTLVEFSRKNVPDIDLVARKISVTIPAQVSERDVE